MFYCVYGQMSEIKNYYYYYYYYQLVQLCSNCVCAIMTKKHAL